MIPFASPDPLPEPLELPHAAHAGRLFPALDPLLAVLHLPPPDAADPAPQPVLDALPLHGPLLGDQGRRHERLAGHALGRQDGAGDEGLGRRAVGQAAREADGDEAAGQLARDHGGLGEEDGARDQVGQGRAARGRQHRREAGADPPEAVVVQDRREGEVAEAMGRLCIAVSRRE